MKAKCIAQFKKNDKIIKEDEIIELSKDEFEKMEKAGCVEKIKGSFKTTDIEETPLNRQMKPKRKRRYIANRK